MSTQIKHTLGVRLYRPPARAFLRMLYRVLTHFRIHGQENVPPHSAYLLTINHLSYYDPPIPLCFWPYPPEALGAEETMATRPIIGRIMRWYGTWPVLRDGDDRTALRTALTILRSGFPLLIAPEGTRHPSGMRYPHPGAAFLRAWCPFVSGYRDTRRPGTVCVLEGRKTADWRNQCNSASSSQRYPSALA